MMVVRCHGAARGCRRHHRRWIWMRYKPHRDAPRSCMWRAATSFANVPHRYVLPIPCPQDGTSIGLLANISGTRQATSFHAGCVAVTLPCSANQEWADVHFHCSPNNTLPCHIQAWASPNTTLSCPGASEGSASGSVAGPDEAALQLQAAGASAPASEPASGPALSAASDPVWWEAPAPAPPAGPAAAPGPAPGMALVTDSSASEALCDPLLLDLDDFITDGIPDLTVRRTFLLPISGSVYLWSTPAPLPAGFILYLRDVRPAKWPAASCPHAANLAVQACPYV